jgi:hypothetical protein
MADTFGAPEISPKATVQSSGNSRTIVILLILIIGGGAVLGYLLYRQNQEPAPVLEEVTQTVEVPTTPAANPATTPAANPAAGISEPATGTVPAPNTPVGLPTSVQE